MCSKFYKNTWNTNIKSSLILDTWFHQRNKVCHKILGVKLSGVTKWVECSPMVRETWFQSQVASYQRFLKWYSILPCLTLSNIRYISRVKWSNPGKGVVPSPTSWCSSYWKGSLLVANFILLLHDQYIYHYSTIISKVHNGYQQRQWNQQYEFKSLMGLFAFHFVLILLKKAWIQLSFSYLVGHTRCSSSLIIYKYLVVTIWRLWKIMMIVLFSCFWKCSFSIEKKKMSKFVKCFFYLVGLLN